MCNVPCEMCGNYDECDLPGKTRTCRCFIYNLPGHENYKSPFMSDEVYYLVYQGTRDAFDWIDGDKNGLQD